MSGNVLDAELEARRNNSVLTLKWDKTDLEIKTRSVEWTLQPLINQVFLFCNVKSKRLLLLFSINSSVLKYQVTLRSTGDFTDEIAISDESYVKKEKRSLQEGN